MKRRRTTNQISFQIFCPAFSQDELSSVLLGAGDLWKRVPEEGGPARKRRVCRQAPLWPWDCEETVAEEGISVEESLPISLLRWKLH